VVVWSPRNLFRAWTREKHAAEWVKTPNLEDSRRPVGKRNTGGDIYIYIYIYMYTRVCRGCTAPVVHYSGTECSPTVAAVIFNTFNTLHRAYIYIYIYICISVCCTYISSVMFVRIESQYWRDEDAAESRDAKTGAKTNDVPPTVYILWLFSYFSSRLLQLTRPLSSPS
jgi:hypothetical protein